VSDTRSSQAAAIQKFHKRIFEHKDLHGDVVISSYYLHFKNIRKIQLIPILGRGILAVSSFFEALLFHIGIINRKV